ncbi:molybdopterin-dependent oxidoreductase [Brevibacterium marinum]|uniref:DMSO/TMAO reductase YedYZ molybdopterin-dependent catalytic subunit n=1 Tax=Brevibacterium marinum TaxID=418643 RepID=A0A846S569_9MICO|nr:molybdopterin-dependent oxidoreductase [Brevibacterium marinum]NJC58118.1 DMSO/TMAO reductase YedYZ molybdopterin-dependent catalytic subunit [Brevibacterium marinum]
MIDRRPLLFTLSGIVATLVYFGAAEFIAGAFSAASAPLLILGQTIIPLVPTAMIKAAISVFGTNDKLALVITLVLVGAVLGGVIGRIGLHRRTLSFVLLIGLGILPVVLLLSTGGTILDSIPALGGVALGCGAYIGLIRLGEGVAPAGDLAGRPGEAADPITPPRGTDRRTFFGLAGGLSAVGVAAIAAGQSASILARNAAGAVTKLVLPPPATSAPEIPAGADLGIDGLATIMTPNEDFYRIDTALIPPAVDASSWSLRIHGMVEQDVTITMAELLDLPLEEHRVSLACVSNEVGGDLVGNATWLGYPVRELLKRARPSADADMVLSTSDDGFTASTPLEVLTDDRASLLAVGMNGEPLPRDHGFPARLVVPGLYGFVSATKWVTELEVTRFADEEAYWTKRGWSTHGPILVASRVDVPRAGVHVSPNQDGQVVTAGMAWAQHVGIAEVRVRIDTGEWHTAQLSEELNTDTWRQWRCAFDDLDPGTHTVTVRAVDEDGNVQISERRPAIPGSATGLHERQFVVD